MQHVISTFLFFWNLFQELSTVDEDLATKKEKFPVTT